MCCFTIRSCKPLRANKAMKDELNGKIHVVLSHMQGTATWAPQILQNILNVKAMRSMPWSLPRAPHASTGKAISRIHTVDVMSKECP